MSQMRRQLLGTAASGVGWVGVIVATATNDWVRTCDYAKATCVRMDELSSRGLWAECVISPSLYHCVGLTQILTLPGEINALIHDVRGEIFQVCLAHVCCDKSEWAECQQNSFRLSVRFIFKFNLLQLNINAYFTLLTLKYYVVDIITGIVVYQQNIFVTRFFLFFLFTVYSICLSNIRIQIKNTWTNKNNWTNTVFHSVCETFRYLLYFIAEFI